MPFSPAATDLMAERARNTLGLFRGLKDEFASMEMLVAVKLAYDTDDGSPHGREHLWFAVHEITADKVDGTLANRPFNVSGLQEGQRGEHDLSRLTDWILMTPEGPITPRNISAARRLRTNWDEWQARINAAKQAPSDTGRS